MIAAATQASVAAGRELTFIAAADADWPRLLYANLDYETVGDLITLCRDPAWIE